MGHFNPDPHCRRGHVWKENTVYTRHCRKCLTDAMRRSRQRNQSSKKSSAPVRVSIPA